MRVLWMFSFALLAMTACSTGSPESNFDPESSATSRGMSYNGTFPDAPAGEDTTRCFPTGGVAESDHAGVGPFFCDY